MIKINKVMISRIVTVLVVVLFVWYLLTHLGDFKALLNIHPVYVVLLLLISVLSLVVNGIFMKWAISLFDKKINVHESVRVSLISSAGNFFAPAGSGLGFRAIYLKKRHGLLYSDYISVTFCNYVMVFFVSSLLGLLSLYSIDPQYTHTGSLALAAFFGLLLLASIVAFFVRIKDRGYELVKQGWIKRILGILVRISDGWRLIIGHKRIMTGLSILILLNTALSILSTFLIMHSLAIHLSLGSLVLFSVLGSLSLFINITPGNLGVKEAVYLLFSTVIGLTTAQILSAALIDRAVLFFVLSILWLVYGRKFYGNASPETIDSGEEA